MADNFGRFAAVPIGPLLAARDGGLTLATTAEANLNRMARSDVAQSAGTVGVEFAVWGDDDVSAVIGLATAAAPLNSYPGAAAGGVGWELGTGRVLLDGAPVASGLALGQEMGRVLHDWVSGRRQTGCHGRIQFRDDGQERPIKRRGRRRQYGRRPGRREQLPRVELVPARQASAQPAAMPGRSALPATPQPRLSTAAALWPGAHRS